jgi:hypothetical protein
MIAKVRLTPGSNDTVEHTPIVDTGTPLDWSAASI